MSPLLIWCLESHFPIIGDVVIFRFLAKIPRVFDWKKQGEIEQFGFYINTLVKIPFAFAWAFPEFDRVLMMAIKEDSKVMENESHLFLKRVRWWVKYLSCYMDRVSNNNDFGNILKSHCLVDSTSNGKEFCFHTSDINCMKYFGNWFVVGVYVSYWSGHIVFDTCICDYKCIR